jgi:AraC-like DNA-binding protein
MTVESPQQIDHVVYQPSITTKELHSPLMVETSELLPLPYGILHQKQWYFDGLRIRYTKNHYHDHFSFEQRNTLDVVNLEFNIKGNYTIRHYGNVYRVRNHQHNVVYTPGVNNTFENDDLTTETFVVQFLPDVFLRIAEGANDTLKHFAEAVLDRRAVVLSPTSLPITPAIQRVIHDVIHCPYTGSLKKVFLLSKALEILVLQAEDFHRVAQSAERYSKDQRDRDKIIDAMEYVKGHPQSPPSLTELSRIVGLNEYKLKRGFKEMFHQTVFGFLADYRLELARQYLNDTGRTISDIAFELGYSSPQHFSYAFKKKYGASPRSARLN